MHKHQRPKGTGALAIPEEAVEAAAKAIYESESYQNRWDWPVSELDREEYRKHARAALKAAMPHILQHFANHVDWRCADCEDPIDADMSLRLMRHGTEEDFK